MSVVTTGRLWRLYRFYDDAGHLLYIGMTDGPARRLAEHLRTQPWADEVAHWVRDSTGYSTPEQARSAERQAIWAERPRYNIVHNGRNPRRVDPRTMRRPARWSAHRPVGRWRRWWLVPMALSVLWLVLACAVWWAVAERVPARDGAGLGAVVSTVVLAAGSWGTRTRRRA
jgi:hypothetical protein